MIRILFIGCVEGSYRLLNELIKNRKNVVGVITKEYSSFNADYCDLTALCKDNNIPFHYVHNANDQDSLDFIKGLFPDICFCFGWSQLLKEELIGIFPMGVVGFHPAALPNNRGRHPLIWALALGLEQTASTFFMINKSADEGDIISQSMIEITYEDDARTLYDKVMDSAVKQEIKIVESFENNNVCKKPQLPNTGNSWRKRGKADGQIDWRMSSRAIYNLVRSLTKPYVGAHFVFKEKDYKVWKVKELDIRGFKNIEPGKVIEVNDDGSIDVRVSDGVIRLTEFEHLQIEKGDYLL